MVDEPVANEWIDRAIAIFQQENARDPNSIMVSGQARPKELVAAERLVTAVSRLTSSPSVALRLASHCQHLRRWEVPRTSQPEGRIGYLKWRKAAAAFHAEQAERILRGVGCDEQTMAAVRRINLKQDPGSDPDVQTMEDALCLSFLEHELSEFAAKHAADKLGGIIKKTWRKMSDRGRLLALMLPLPDVLQDFLRAALGIDDRGNTKVKMD
jgi:hypothetical protein